MVVAKCTVFLEKSSVLDFYEFFIDSERPIYDIEKPRMLALGQLILPNDEKDIAIFVGASSAPRPSNDLNRNCTFI